MRKLGINFKIERVFSCEWTASKRSWITANLPVQKMFGDIQDLGETKAHNYISGDMEEVPSAEVVFIGFSCKSASSMNGDRATLCLEMAGSNWKQAGSTGHTLDGFFRWLQRHKASVRIIIMENVLGLLWHTPMGRPIDALIARLAEHGFKLGYEVLNACDYSLPQRRRRVWMWAFPDSHPSEAHDKMKETLKSLELPGSGAQRLQDIFSHGSHLPLPKTISIHKTNPRKGWVKLHDAYVNKHRLKPEPLIHVPALDTEFCPREKSCAWALANIKTSS